MNRCRAHEELAKAGKSSGGGDRGFGYTASGRTIKADEAKLIRDAVKRVLAGDSLRSVVRRWNQSKTKTSSGRTWYTSAVRIVLNSAPR